MRCIFSSFHAVLNLLGLRRLVAELLDERLHVRDLFRLLRSLLLQTLPVFVALAQIRRVIAFVKLQAAAVDFGHAVDHVVHEGAVVRDHDHGAFIAAQKAFEPFHAFEVEMVGRLVKQKHVGLANQKLREGDAHLPSAGEFPRRARHVVLFESKAEHDASDLGFKHVSTERFVDIARTAARFEHIGGRIRPEAFFELLQPAFRLEHFGLA